MTGRAHMSLFLRPISKPRAGTVFVPQTIRRTVPGDGSNTTFRLASLRGYPTIPFLSSKFPERTLTFRELTAKAAVLAALFCIILPFTVKAEDAKSKAPSFRLPDTKGAVLALDDFSGKVILLNFWATWCTSCREELTELDRLYHQYRDNGFTVIAINVDTSAERAAAFLNKRPVGFPVVTDTQGTVADAYRFSGLPAGFLIGRDGVIERRYRGSGKDLISLYEKDIEALLKRKY